MTSITAYIAVGSNLGDSNAIVHSAFDAINNIPKTTLTQRSSLHQTKPMGPQDQPDYLNAAAEIKTTLSPYELLKELQRIENEHGRIRTEERWGPRTLDLDLLLFGDEKINTPDLIVPHPGLFERDFVLKPLLEIHVGDLKNA